MDTSLPLTTTHARVDAEASTVEIPQLTRRAILAIWAAAALPMAALSWLVAPVLADQFAGDGVVPMAKALIVCLTVGLVWQFLLVAVLVRREQRTLRWSTVREALWLRSPRSPRSGPRRRPDLADPDSLDRGRRSCAGADPDVRGSLEPGPRHARRIGRRQGVPRRRLGLVRPSPRDVPVQHRARRGAPVSRVPAPAHERGRSAAATGSRTASSSPSTTCTCRG